MNTILQSVKDILGIPAEDDFFNPTLILHINSVFSILRQLNCGPAEGYTIMDDTNTWDEFLQNEPEKLQLVKTYMALKVRQLFDTPTNGIVANALTAQVSEFEWRISTLCDPGEQP